MPEPDQPPLRPTSSMFPPMPAPDPNAPPAEERAPAEIARYFSAALSTVDSRTPARFICSVTTGVDFVTYSRPRAATSLSDLSSHSDQVLAELSTGRAQRTLAHFD